MRTPIVQTTDHEQILKWANQYTGVPCLNKSNNELALCIGFPDGKEEYPVLISWDEWFTRFEEAQLALQYRNEIAKGEKLPWYQLIPRQAEGIDPHLQTPAEANTEKHINFLEEEERAS